MNPSTLSSAEVAVTLGVDTHKDVHVAVALDELGGYLGTLSVPATKDGARRLMSWATGFWVPSSVLELRERAVTGRGSHVS